MTQLLIPGLTCADVVTAPRAGMLVDGHDFYQAVVDACRTAERSILMAGWQFDANVHLLRGDEEARCDHPTRLIEFLADLCRTRKDLEIHVLAWDASAIFTFERMPFQKLKFRAKGCDRIHYEMDNKHPTGASHHQKIVVVDDSIAMVGGMDICNARWDVRSHPAVSPLRVKKPYGRYTPFHDVQAFVTGDAVRTVRRWFYDRWQLATGASLELGAMPVRDVPIRPSVEVEAPMVALARTLPRMDDPASAPVIELYELHLRAIAAARRLIYIENQYLSCDEIATAIERRMRAETTEPLEVVLVLPEKSAGFKERISIGVYQQRILERLGKVAAATGHHLGVYYTAARGPDGDVPVFIHAKVLAVDDRFLLVSSANTSNRSMGFDTELGLAWEAPSPTTSLRQARIDLLGEHVGLDGALADRVLGDPVGRVARLDGLARGGQHRLRMHARNVDEKPGWLLSKLVPDETPFDPDDPRDFHEALPEPGRWLDRLIAEPLEVAWNAVRHRRARGTRSSLKR